jgi:hypothetical protein
MNVIREEDFGGGREVKIKVPISLQVQIQHASIGCNAQVK